MALGVQNGTGTLGDPNINGSLAMARRKSKRSKYAKDYDLFAYAEDNRPSIVYLATNVLNGKRYIGMTRQTMERRKGQHIASAQRNGDRYSIFHKAIRKYGAAAFHFEILYECASYKEAGIAEVRLIADLKPEYNLGSGGESIPNIGYRPSEASRLASQKRMKGRPGYWTGKKRPDIAAMQRVRMRANPPKHMLGRKHTAETIAKIKRTKAESGPSAKHLAAMAKRRKRIVCVDDGRIFIGTQAVADAIGCSQKKVICHLGATSPRKKLLGLRFAYVGEHMQ